MISTRDEIAEPGKLQYPMQWLAWDVKTIVLGTPFVVPVGATIAEVEGNGGLYQMCQ